MNDTKDLFYRMKPFIQQMIGSNAASGSTAVFGPASYPDALLRDGSRSLIGSLAVGSGVTIDGVDIDVFAANTAAWQAGHIAALDPHPVYLLRTEVNHIGAGQVILNGAGQINFGGFTVDLPDSGTVALGAGGLSAASINNYSTPNHTHAVAYAPGNVADTLVGTNNRAGLSLGSVSYDYTPTLAKWGAGDNTFANLVLNGTDYTTLAFHDSGVRVDAIRAGQGIIDVGFDAGWGSASVRMPGASISGETFASGFAGSGWRIDNGVSYTNETTAEFDNLIVRGLMRVYELIINKIRVSRGSLIVSPGGGKVAAVSGGGPYTLTFDDEHGLVVNDLLRAQKFTGTGTYVSRLTVTAVPTSTTATVTLFSGNAPEAGYEYAVIGNTSDANRQGLIYLTADDSGAPFMDVVDGVAAHGDWGLFAKTKARLGKLTGITDGYWGALSGYGLYSNNIYLTGAIRAMSGRIDGVLDIGTSGEIRQGTGTFGTNFTGTRMFNTGGVGRWATYNNNVAQAYVETNGGVYAGGGNVWMNAGGFNLLASYDSTFTQPVPAPATTAQKLRFYSLGPSVTSQQYENASVYSRLTGNDLNPDTLGNQYAYSTLTIEAKNVDYTAAGPNGIIDAVTRTTVKSRIHFVSDELHVSGVVKNNLVIGSSSVYRYIDGLAIGDINTNYTPSGAAWTNADAATLLLQAQDYSVIAFHDAGSRVDYIRVGAGVITLGYNGGFGSAAVNIPGGVVVETASNPTLLNSWVNYGGSFETARFWKDALGMVHAVGVIKSGTTTGGTVIFTLPSGYRPAANVIFAAVSNDVACRVDANSNGDVVIYNVSSSIYLSFSFSFRA